MSSVRVRMYRQGLGDCFLLTFSTGATPAHMLIDCGVLKGTRDANAVMRTVAESVVETTGGQLDVLVATHEHWDHLSGFLQAKEVFDGLDVGEVWLAWTEDPDDELAAELRKRKARTIRALAAAARGLKGARSASGRATLARLEALLNFLGDLSLAGRPTTAGALDWVKDRDARIRFLGPGDRRSALGVNVYVLGPPHDRAMIKRSDPSKRHPEVYELVRDMSADLGFLAATESLEGGGEPGRQPFARWYRLSEEEARKQELFATHYFGRTEGWRRIEHDWLGVAGRLALQLDSDTNNTSLALAFELFDGGPVLLFPGDAQVGNWLSWESLEWPGGNGDSITRDELLGRTVLYKVGHHGSHNATLRENGLELMTNPDLAAMVPVNRETAKKMDWNMPFPSLFKRLEERTRGRIMDAELGVAAEQPAGLPAEQWKSFLARTDVQPGWVDYTLEW
jgi:hypothetical protein